MREVKVIGLRVNAEGALEKSVRVIPTAEASMMEGLAGISTPEARRKAVNRMVGNAKSFSERDEPVNA